jgi:MraZ protein
METGPGHERAGRPPSGDTAAGTVATAATALAPRPLFVGSYEHAIDEKNRLALPAAFRADLAPGAYMGPLVDQLGVWLREEYEQVLDKWENGVDLGVVAPELYERFLALTFAIQPDAQGRFVVPPKCREFAGIGRDVVVKGGRSRVEVWSQDRWHGLFANQDDPDAALRQAVRDLRLS